MSLLSMTDCSVADNRVQARYELDRAAVSAESVAGHFYAAWALKWGRALLDYADAAMSEDDLALAESVSDDNATNAHERAEAIRDAVSSLKDIINDLENSL